MGRVKIAKKSTFIDMTAMSDVTVLLLTFFMLTSTFLQKEPITVRQPESVTQGEKVQETNVVQILVSDKGQVWLTMTNDTSQNWSNEKMRAELLTNVTKLYNDQVTDDKKKVKFTDQQIAAFAKIGTFGVPMAEMPEFLSLYDQPEGPTKMDNWLSGKDPTKKTGIPIAPNKVTPKTGDRGLNEFQMWLKAIAQSSNKNLIQAIKDGNGMALKADVNTSYDHIFMVMDNMRALKLNKFTLLTAQKVEE